MVARRLFIFLFYYYSRATSFLSTSRSLVEDQFLEVPIYDWMEALKEDIILVIQILIFPLQSSAQGHNEGLEFCYENMSKASNFQESRSRLITIHHQPPIKDWIMIGWWRFDWILNGDESISWPSTKTSSSFIFTIIFNFGLQTQIIEVEDDGWSKTNEDEDEEEVDGRR